MWPQPDQAFRGSLLRRPALDMACDLSQLTGPLEIDLRGSDIVDDRASALEQAASRNPNVQFILDTKVIADGEF